MEILVENGKGGKNPQGFLQNYCLSYTMDLVECMLLGQCVGARVFPRQIILQYLALWLYSASHNGVLILTGAFKHYCNNNGMCSEQDFPPWKWVAFQGPLAPCKHSTNCLLWAAAPETHLKDIFPTLSVIPGRGAGDRHPIHHFLEARGELCAENSLHAQISLGWSEPKSLLLFIPIKLD